MCHILGKIGINAQCLSHTQSMEKQINQKSILTKANQAKPIDSEWAFAFAGEDAFAQAEKGKGMFLSAQDAEEYRAYKRRKKVEEIMSAIAKSEASLMNGEDPQRVCERAIRLKQASIKVPPSWLPQAKTYLGGSKVKIDCMIGGNGETLTKVKAYEMRVALRGNAKELTVLIAPSMIAQNRFLEIRKELKKLRRIAKRTVMKVWVNNDYPFATLSKIARMCCELGVEYFCVPYFSGCERLRFDLTNGCQIEVSEVENLAEYRKLCESGVGRIVTRNIWEIYSEWIKEADRIKEEGAAVLLPSSTANSVAETQPTALNKEKIENPKPITQTVQAIGMEKQDKKTEMPAQQISATATHSLAPSATQAPSMKQTTASAQTAVNAKQTQPLKQENKSEENKQKEKVNETSVRKPAMQNDVGHARLEGSDLKFM